MSGMVRLAVAVLVHSHQYHAGNSTFAALTAAFSANLVLAGYIFMSMQEEKNATSIQQGIRDDKPSTESKKDK
jgi:hypothetical protein